MRDSRQAALPRPGRVREVQVVVNDATAYERELREPPVPNQRLDHGQSKERRLRVRPNFNGGTGRPSIQTLLSLRGGALLAGELPCYRRC